MKKLFTLSLLLMSMTCSAYADVNISRSESKVYKNITDLTISDTSYYSTEDKSGGSHTVVLTIGSKEIKTDNKSIYTDEAPYISCGRTMLPLRAVGETLKLFENSFNISWNSADKEATVIYGDNNIVFKAGSSAYTHNGRTKKLSGGAPEIKNGRLFLPLRDIADTMGLNIEWNSLDKEVTIKA